MFSKEENKQIKVDFYTALGVRMKRHIALSGEKIKWVNYKTGIKGLAFKMEIDKRIARLFVEIKHSDTDIQDLVYQQFEEYKVVLEQAMPSDTIWFSEDYNILGEKIAKIEWQQEAVSIYKKDTWGTAFDFYEAHWLTLDDFWADIKPIFEDLVN